MNVKAKSPQHAIHRLADAIARMNYLETKNKELSVSNMRKVNAKDKEFKSLYRDVKKTITVKF